MVNATLALRNFMKDKMYEAFKSRRSNLPTVGVKGTPLEIALSYCKDIPALSIEVVANYHGIAGIYYGNISQSFNDAVTKLNAISIINTESTKSAIISVSNRNRSTFDPCKLSKFIMEFGPHS